MSTQNTVIKDILPFLISSLVSAGLIALTGYIFLIEKGQLDLQNLKTAFEKIENEVQSQNQQISLLRLFL